jgi:hypothetical protein
MLKLGKLSGGVIVRGEKGQILLTAWVQQPAIVEADCVAMISALRTGSDSKRPWEGVPREITAACNLLPNYNFAVVRREANDVGHTLAKYALAGRNV